jgi:hypothetical protein
LTISLSSDSQVDTDSSGQIDFSEFLELIHLVGKAYSFNSAKKLKRDSLLPTDFQAELHKYHHGATHGGDSDTTTGGRKKTRKGTRRTTGSGGGGGGGTTVYGKEPKIHPLDDLQSSPAAALVPVASDSTPPPHPHAHRPLRKRQPRHHHREQHSSSDDERDVEARKGKGEAGEEEEEEEDVASVSMDDLNDGDAFLQLLRKESLMQERRSTKSGKSGEGEFGEVNQGREGEGNGDGDGDDDGGGDSSSVISDDLSASFFHREMRGEQQPDDLLGLQYQRLGREYVSSEDGDSSSMNSPAYSFKTLHFPSSKGQLVGGNGNGNGNYSTTLPISSTIISSTTIATESATTETNGAMNGKKFRFAEEGEGGRGSSSSSKGASHSYLER